MTDLPPQRANAAQLATRNIKPKPKGSLGRRQPFRSALSASSGQPFSSTPSQGGGLFGGNVHAPGTFDFSAPSGGLSFPSPSFGSSSNNPFAHASFASNTSSDASESEGGDHRADTTGEEAARRSKLFRTGDSRADSEAHQQNTPFQMSSSFGGQQQQSNPFVSTNGEEKPGGGIFSFGQNNSQPSSTAINFNSTSTQDKPTASIFSFGATSTQNQQSSPGINFGSTSTQDKPTQNIFSFGQPAAQPIAQIAVPSALTQDKPANSIFNFGQQPEQPTQPPTSSTGFNFNSPAASQDRPTSNSIFSFGSPAPQDKPANNTFSFSQSLAQPSSSGISFGPAQGAEKPANNGVSQPQQPTNLFGSSTQPPTDSNMFANLKPQISPGSSLFENKSQSSTPDASSVFGGQSCQQVASSNNIFSQPPAATSNVFAEPNQQPTLSNNLFGDLNKQSGLNDMFSSSDSQPSQSSSIFSSLGKNVAPGKNLFGNLNKPVDERLVQEQINGGGSTDADSNPQLNTSVTTSSLFNRASSNKPAFGVSEQPVSLFASTSTCVQQDTSCVDQPISPNIIADCPSICQIPSQYSMNIFSRITRPPVEASTSVVNLSNSQNPLPDPTSLFARVTRPRVGEYGAAFATFSKSTSSLSSVHPFFKVTDVFSSKASTTPASKTETSDPPKISTPHFGSTQPSTAPSHNVQFSPLKLIDAPSSASQPPPSGMFPSLSQSANSQPSPMNTFNQSKAPTFAATSGPQLSSPSKVLVESIEPKEINNISVYPEMAAACEITEEFMAPLVPEHFTELQRREFYAAYRMRSLNKAMQKFFGNIPLGMEITNAMMFYGEKRKQILTRSRIQFQNVKRKVADEEDENENPSKRARQLDTSNLNQLPGKAKATSPFKPPTSPNKKLNRSPERAENASPFNHQQYFNATNSTAFQLSVQNTEPSASPSPKGKRKAEAQLVNPRSGKSWEGEEPQDSASKTIGSFGGSETSNIFKNILNSPSKSVASPEKKRLESLASSNSDPPRINPFGNLPGAASTASAAKTANAAPNFAFVPTTSPSSTNPVSKVNPFSRASSSEQKTIKPPTFGTSPINFLAQFGQKASKDSEDHEKKLMEEAKAEDLDSDEDEAEWEAKYREKRRAELKAIEDISKSKHASFVVGKGFAFGDAEKGSGAATASISSNAVAPIASKPLFGQTAPQSAGNSLFSSLNGSTTSTPSPLASNTGSVLDGHTPGKPVSFGRENIFAHLSDVESGADKGDDSDDESTNGESDSENKDPTYQPPANTEPGSDTGSGPTTPVEKTGEGIASAKKATFGEKFGSSFGAITNSGSGSISPGGSLFDRISKDNNGNPIRQVSTEEKENAKPSTTNIFGNSNNIFGNSNKTPGTQPDKTWKADSPIRFGSTIPNNASTNPAPSVNITAASPSKTPTPHPFAGLFGNSNASKPASSLAAGVGFGFGGPSSATSSLFPSAAASTTTSRATSPGGTTDGDSAAEANSDPDAEYHEQIDLTRGGAGEEDEEILYEVRAKALIFSPKGDGEDNHGWDTKGIGPLRVLKHKETKTARILLRADPSGSVVLNKAILSQVDYKATGKTVKLLTAGEAGKGIETWILQVKTPEFAKSLADVLESNKPSA